MYYELLSPYQNINSDIYISREMETKVQCIHSENLKRSEVIFHHDSVKPRLLIVRQKKILNVNWNVLTLLTYS